MCSVSHIKNRRLGGAVALAQILKSNGTSGRRRRTIESNLSGLLDILKYYSVIAQNEYKLYIHLCKGIDEIYPTQLHIIDNNAISVHISIRSVVTSHF